MRPFADIYQEVMRKRNSLRDEVIVEELPTSPTIAREMEKETKNRELLQKMRDKDKERARIRLEMLRKQMRLSK